jgi:transcriptional regulator with XRE-family HTH domain
VNLKAFGQNVYRSRMALKMSQEQFAEAINVSRTYLQTIEAGKGNPTIQVVDRIKKACKCSWDDILGKL